MSAKTIKGECDICQKPMLRHNIPTHKATVHRVGDMTKYTCPRCDAFVGNNQKRHRNTCPKGPGEEPAPKKIKVPKFQSEEIFENDEVPSVEVEETPITTPVINVPVEEAPITTPVIKVPVEEAPITTPAKLPAVAEVEIVEDVIIVPTSQPETPAAPFIFDRIASEESVS
jgi:hypothetical protein